MLATAVAVASFLALSACSGSGTASVTPSAAAHSPTVRPVPAQSPDSTQPSAGNQSATATPSASPAPTGYLAVVPDGKITTAAICSDYESTLSKYGKSAQAYIASGRSRTKDPYKAASYVKHVNWVHTSYADKFKAAITKSATKSLNAISDGQAGIVDSVDDYLKDSLAACGLTDSYDKTVDQAAKVDQLAGRITAQAENKPWYPKGYQEATDGVAIKWIDSAADPCGYGPRCWFWTIDVVSDTGCPSGLYVAVNFTRGGTVVDWSNDTLPSLREGQKGRLQFYTYDRSTDAIELAEVNCY